MSFGLALGVGVGFLLFVSRALDAVALATNGAVFTFQCT